MPWKQIPICTRTHGDIQVFHSISPILLILRILTGQRFRKERFVHEACMGCIMEGVECLNSIKTDSDSHQNSWSYSGFSCPFCYFEDFSRPAFQEGVVYSLSLYRINFRG